MSVSLRTSPSDAVTFWFSITARSTAFSESFGCSPKITRASAITEASAAFHSSHHTLVPRSLE
ncbi:hypothetical protein BKE56_000770 [Rhodococcus sp. M8]|nr:hypothetical protein BKE56_000770 [Rhodococcus sp. M8]